LTLGTSKRKNHCSGFSTFGNVFASTFDREAEPRIEYSHLVSFMKLAIITRNFLILVGLFSSAYAAIAQAPTGTPLLAKDLKADVPFGLDGSPALIGQNHPAKTDTEYQRSQPTHQTGLSSR
jgi:hypothetical protein